MSANDGSVCCGPTTACELLSRSTRGGSGHFAQAIELAWTKFYGEKFRILFI